MDSGLRVPNTPNNGKPRINTTSVEVEIPGVHLGKSLAGRRRVHAATDKAANQGNWQEFTLNTDPAQLQRTWVHEKAATAVPNGELLRIVIQPTPTPTSTPTPKVTPTPVKLVTPKPGVFIPGVIGILNLEPKIDLQIEVFERCSTNTALECSWGKKVINYRGEPFDVPYVRRHPVRA